MPKGKYIKTKQHRLNLSNSLKGRHHTLQTREKLKLTSKGNHNALGKKHPHTEEEKRKISQNHSKYWLGKKRPELSGVKNPSWNNGSSFKPYSVNWTETLKRAIRERDKYICKICLGYGEQIHHIDYNKLNCNPINLITLCNSCHSKTNFNRKYWKNKLENEV